jgi:C4-dicarboxylate-specific signal transduction histidine kinase
MPPHSPPRKRASPPSSSRRRQRASAQKALTQRLRFESLLLELSATFARAPADNVGPQVEIWLGKLAEFIGADRSSLWELAAAGDQVRLLYFYSKPGTPPPVAHRSTEEVQWLTNQYRCGNVVAWARVPDDIPISAVGERAWAQSVSAKSTLCIPMRAGSTVRSLVFTCVRRYRKWPAPLIERLRLVAEIFSSALSRQSENASLQASESRNRALLKALPDQMFVLSPEGVYLDHSGDASQLLVPPEQFLGRRIEEVLPQDLAARFRDAFVRASVTGEVVELQFPLVVRNESRSYEVRLVRRDDGAIVTITREITEHIRARREIESLRLELMHFGRVALMGRLTTSLVHELAQPITAAIGNLEAGQRSLEVDHADLDGTPAILADVLDSCLRAAEVLRGISGLLNKEPRPKGRVDLNRLVTEVAEIVHSDLIRRQIRLVMRLDPALPYVNGQPIELQQVILNLLLNGADALSESAPLERELIITTTQHAQGIELTVRDWGVGANPAHLRRMFEPFFTTKPNGIGMGLSICADIIRSHYGSLTAENNADGGLTMRCLLPLPGEPRPAP